MQEFVSVHMGQSVRLTTPYLDAARGIYTVIYVYRNGWLGVVSHIGGRRYDVPGHICRPVDAAANTAKSQVDLSLQHAEG